MVGGRAVLALGLLLSGTSAQQAFTTEPKDQLVAPGHNTSLTCMVDNMAGECRWQKGGKPVGLFPGKYSVPGRKGDCSLAISNVDLRIDDGEWECQITSSSFSSGDALASRKARLTVQAPPESISIQSVGGLAIRPGGLLTVTEDLVSQIECVTRFSNPAPTISWLLSGVAVPTTSQTNTTESGTNKWRSEALLNYTFTKADMGKRLECLVKHVAYPKGEEITLVSLDVLYKPNVRIARVDGGSVLEDGISSLSLSCISESNPPAQVMWSRRGPGVDSTPQYTEVLEFNPVTRRQAGAYLCSAENSVGRSSIEETMVDVLYAPTILATEPRVERSVMVHNRTVLTCRAEGNPPPKYQWLQRLPQDQVLKRGYEADLVIGDAGYSDQGEYTCRAINMVGGERRETSSDVIRIQVSGVPQVVKQVGDVVGVNGHDVRLEAEFCSDPLPLTNTWQWGGTVLPAGSELDSKYKAELLTHPHMENCYISRLTVRGVGLRDSRPYTLLVENKHGRDTVPVLLNIRDPVSMTSVIAVVIALLVIFLVLVVSLLIAYKKQKLCFQDSEKEKEAEGGGFGPNAYINGSAGSKISLTKDAGLLPPSPGHYLAPSTKV